MGEKLFTMIGLAANNGQRKAFNAASKAYETGKSTSASELNRAAKKHCVGLSIEPVVEKTPESEATHKAYFGKGKDNRISLKEDPVSA